MTSHKLSFGRDVLITAVATALKSLRNLLLIRFISVNLSMADYGVWEQIAVGIALITPWLSLQLPSALLRFLPGIEDKQRWRDDFYSVLFFVVTTASIVALLAWSGRALLPNYSHLEPFIAHAGLIALLIPLTVAVNTVITLLRAMRQMVIHSALTLAQNFGEFLLIGYLLGHGHDLGAALFSLSIVRGAILLAGLSIAYAQFGISWPTFTRLRPYLLYTIPLVPNSSLYHIFNAGDRYVLSYFTDHTAVGTYAAAYTVSSFFTTLVSPINMVLLPVMAELWNHQQKRELGDYLTQSIRYSTLVSLPALAGACYFTSPLLSLLVSDAAPQIAPPFIVLSVSFLIFGIGIVGGNVLATAGQTRLLLTVDFSLATFNIVLNLLLVPIWGIMGAAISTLLSHVFYTGIVLYKANKTAAFRMPWLSIIHCASGAALMIGTLYLLDSLILIAFPLQIVLGAVVYGIFMVISGGIEQREVSFFINVVKGVFR